MDLLGVVLTTSNINKNEFITTLIKEQISVFKRDGVNKCDELQVIGNIETFMSFLENSPNSSTISLEVIEDVCLQLIYKIHPSYDSRKNIIILLTRVTSLITVCFDKIEPQSKGAYNLLKEIQSSLEFHHNHKTSNIALETDQGVIDLICCLEILRNLSKTTNIGMSSQKQYCDFQSTVFQILLNILCEIETKSLSSRVIKCLVTLLNVECLYNKECLTCCWKTIEKLLTKDQVSAIPCMFLCSAANYFLPVEATAILIDVRMYENYWRIIQHGLYSKDTLVRKQSMYLLKRTIDMCERGGISFESDKCVDTNCARFAWRHKDSQKLVKLWDDFIMLCEIFEEKQVK